MKADEYQDDLNRFLSDYNYQPKLTEKLDCLGDSSIYQEILNEIVLWKVNRYVSISNSLLDSIDRVKSLKQGEHKKASLLIELLLKARGVDLAMASTILRFRNPAVFQIIDRHAYRAVTGTKLVLYTSTSADKKTSVYFDYLEKLIELCEKKGLRFETVDRLLYLFDKRINGKL